MEQWHRIKLHAVVLSFFFFFGVQKLPRFVDNCLPRWRCRNISYGISWPLRVFAKQSSTNKESATCANSIYAILPNLKILYSFIINREEHMIFFSLFVPRSSTKKRERIPVIWWHSLLDKIWFSIVKLGVLGLWVRQCICYILYIILLLSQ